MYKIIIFCSLFFLILGCDNSTKIPVAEQDEAYFYAEDAAPETMVVSRQSMAAAPEALPSPPPASEGLEKKVFTPKYKRKIPPMMRNHSAPTISRFCTAVSPKAATAP